MRLDSRSSPRPSLPSAPVVPGLLNASEELRVGEGVRQLDLGALSSLGVLLGRLHLRVPPRDVRRERERRESRFGLFENRASVVHQAAVCSTTLKTQSIGAARVIDARSYP